MKVKELIEVLSTFDPELECFVHDMEWGLGKITRPELKKDIRIEYTFSDMPDDVYEKGVVF